jgi:hypothetical protein
MVLPIACLSSPELILLVLWVVVEHGNFKIISSGRQSSCSTTITITLKAA